MSPQLSRDKPAKRLEIAGYRDFVMFRHQAQWTNATRRLALEVLEDGPRVLGEYLVLMRTPGAAPAGAAEEMRWIADFLAGVWADYNLQTAELFPRTPGRKS